MHMSHGVRALNLCTVWEQAKLLNIAYLIVDRLPDLKIIELHGYDDKLIDMSHIFINSLSKLTFITISGCYKHGKLYDKRLRDLQKSSSRFFRTEVANTIDEDTIFIWL
ncbi:unnamed protein product [Rotaria sp. Silwood1]|nr:unnamed protein product [Rotaria sp. Silwood1]